MVVLLPILIRSQVALAALLFAASPSAQAYRPQVEKPEHWVVRTVHPSMWGAPGDPLTLTQARAMGDPNRDGRMDYAIWGNFQFVSEHPYWLVEGGAQVIYGPLDFVRQASYYSSLVLNAGGQYLGVLHKSQLDISVVQVPGFASYATVPLPPPPPGLPPLDGFSAFYPVGDLNGDGFDEFFTYGSARGSAIYSVISLVDGQQLTHSWQNYLANRSYQYFARKLVPQGQSDVDGDGVQDLFVLLFDRIVNDEIVAISGATGAVLWAWQPGPLGGSPDRYVTEVQDLDGDGFTDVVMLQPHWGWPYLHPGGIYAVSGRTGALIWKNLELGYLDPAFATGNTAPGAAGWLRLWSGSSMGDWNRDGVSEYMVLASQSVRTWPPTDRWLVFVFDGATGDFLTRESRAPNLAPYFPEDPLTVRGGGGLLGDVDGDGYTECWADVVAYSFSAPPFWGAHIVITGRRTFLCPEEVPLGTTFALSLDIPSSPNLPFQVLFSDGFAPDRTGLVIAGWDTNLAFGPMLTWSQANPALSGVLNPLGQITLALHVPAIPALSGKTIYGRAWIRDPAGGTAPRTMSSLGTLEIVP